MGRKDMPNDDIERVLREHFKAEAPDLLAPGDPWNWLESRLSPTPRPPLLGRLLSTRRGRFFPATKALAAAAMSIVAVVAVVGVWSVAADSADSSPEGLVGLAGPAGEPGPAGIPGAPVPPRLPGLVPTAVLGAAMVESDAKSVSLDDPEPSVEESSKTALMEGPAIAMPASAAPVSPVDEAPAPTAPESVTEEPATSLSAGEIDDNQRWDDYLRYRSEYVGPPIHEVDVSERYTITVLDSHSRPVPNAKVRVSAGETSVFEGRTYANGQTLFFPLAFPDAEGAETFLFEVEKDGVSPNPPRDGLGDSP